MELKLILTVLLKTFCLSVDKEFDLKYRNATDIFPDELLAEIQKYSSGELIYIPESAPTKKGWGEKSGSRDFYIKRNAQIRQKHEEGKSIAQLAEEFALSTDSIRRILYR